MEFPFNLWICQKKSESTKIGDTGFSLDSDDVTINYVFSSSRRSNSIRVAAVEACCCYCPGPLQTQDPGLSHQDAQRATGMSLVFNTWIYSEKECRIYPDNLMSCCVVTTALERYETTFWSKRVETKYISLSSHCSLKKISVVKLQKRPDFALCLHSVLQWDWF